MSERNDAPRSGGRTAQSRTTTGRRGHGDSRDATTRGTGVRGVRQFSGQSDTRRSGIASGKAADNEAAPRGRSGIASGKATEAAAPRRGRAGSRAGGPVEGTAALALEVTDLEVTSAAPEAAGRPKLWVAPPAPIRAPRVRFAASVIAVVLVGVLGILLINIKTMEQSFRLDALRKEKAALDKQQQGLEQELIQASNPGNLHAAARRLGLVPAESPAMIRLPDGKIIGPPKPGRGPLGPTAQDRSSTDAGR